MKTIGSSRWYASCKASAREKHRSCTRGVIGTKKEVPLGCTKLLLAGAVAAVAALASVRPAESGTMFNMVKLSAQQRDSGRLRIPLGWPHGRAVLDQWSERPSALNLGTEYFAVDTGGNVFFLGGILADSGTRFDLAAQLSLDELVLLSSAKPAILALLGLALLGAGLLNRRRAQRVGRPAL